MDKLLLFPGRTEKGIFTYVIDAEKTYLEKTASEYHPTIASYIQNAKPIRGKTQILLTALGAYEWWGDNVNSDAFEEEQLAHEGDDYGYKTFEKYAKVYKHHCFSEGTLVKTKRGMSPIESVEVGEEVFTHKGRWRKVLDTFRRPYRGNFSTITVQGLGSDIGCTPNHRFLVVRREELLCPRHNSKGEGKNFCTFFRHPEEDKCSICGRNRVELCPEWVEAKDIRPRDYIVRTPESILDDGNLQKYDTGTLAGLFLADGCYTKRDGDYRGVQFTFSEKRTDVHEKLRKSAENLGHLLNGPYLHEKNHTATFSLHSPELAGTFYRQFGEYCHQKFVSREAIEYLGKEGCRYLIGAYLDGDGSLPLAKNRNEGIARARSCNQSLLQTIRDLCFSVGIPASYNFDSKSPKRDNRLVKGTSPSGIIQIAAGHTKSLSKYSLRCEALSRTTVKKGNGEIFYQGQFLHMVRTLENHVTSEVVYNLEVEEDNSYQVYGLNTHNCNKDPSNNYGDVLLSVYNPVFHRVELVVGVRHDNGMDIVQRVERGDYPDWSMGVKVKYDRCSICGNKAPTRAQYCEHAKYMLGKIHPATGRKVFVFNHYPKFFDISQVLIGADRTAKTLRKIASPYYGNIPIISSAYLAEKMAEKKNASMTKEVPGDAPPSSQDTLKSLARGIEQVKAMEEPLPRKVLDSLAEHPLPKVMSTMIMMGILPKPQEFQRIYLVRTGHRELADRLDEHNIAFDPMSVEHPSQERMDEVGLDHHNFSQDLMEKLLPFMSERSYAAPHLGKRIVIMIKKGQELPQPRLIKVADGDERKPLGPIIPLLAAAGAYAALLKTAPKATLKGLDKILASPVGAGLAAALGLGLIKIFNTVATPRAMGQYSSPEAISNPDTNDMFARIEALKQKPLLKVGYHMGSAAKRLFLGVPAAYMASGVLQKHKELSPYDEEGRVRRFIRSNPDVISAALVADAVLSAKGHPISTRSAIEQAKKLIGGAASAFKHKVAYDLSGAGDLDKIADAQDFLSSSLIWPLAMGKANLPGRIVEGLFDQAALEAGSKLWKKHNKDQPSPQKHTVSGSH